MKVICTRFYDCPTDHSECSHNSRHEHNFACHDGCRFENGSLIVNPEAVCVNLNVASRKTKIRLSILDKHIIAYLVSMELK